MIRLRGRLRTMATAENNIVGFPSAVSTSGDKDRFERKLQQKIKAKEVKL